MMQLRLIQQETPSARKKNDKTQTQTLKSMDSIGEKNIKEIMTSLSKYMDS